MKYPIVKISPALYRLAPIHLHIIRLNNDIIAREAYMLTYISNRNAFENAYKEDLKMLFDKPFYKSTSTRTIIKEERKLSDLNQDLLKIAMSPFSLVESFASFASTFLSTILASTSLVLYKSYRIVKFITNSFMTFTMVKKNFVFNKLWLKNESLPKFINLGISSLKYYGLTVVKKYLIFFNKDVIKNKDTLVYHKFDFNNEIVLVQNELDSISLRIFKAYSFFWTYWSFIIENNNSKVLEKLTKIVSLYDKNIKNIERSIFDIEHNNIPVLFRSNDLVDKFNVSSSVFDVHESYFDNIHLLVKLYQTLLGIKDTLSDINVSRGYVASTNIFDPVHYPIICDEIKTFIDLESFNKLNDYEKSSCYKWITNVIILKMYTLCNKALSKVCSSRFKNLDEQELLKETFSRFNVLSKWCFSLLDNSIKQHLVRRNLTIYSDIVSGFDTEYVAEDWGKNTLLSAQLSFSHVLKLFIPLYKGFDFEGVNTLTSETFLKTLPKFQKINLLKSFFTNTISENRYLKFKNHDVIMEKIASYFNYVNNISVTKQGVNIMFDKSVIKNLFILPAEGEVLEINFSTLVNLICKNIDRLKSERYYIDLIKSVDFNGLNEENLLKVCSKLEKSWSGNSMKNSEIETIFLSNEDNIKVSKETSEKVSDRIYFTYRSGFLLENSKIAEAKAELKAQEEEEILLEKEISREEIFSEEESSALLIKGELGGLPQKKDLFLINLRRRLFLSAHYNAADLTLIKDWKDVSLRNIDIVKKCYTSLSKPILSAKEKVYIRDTVLLASATAKTLKALAYAYKMEKVDLSTYYIQNMDFLLKENPEKFKEYAMTDSLITLIHSLFINDFSFKLGSLNIPNTLGTLSSKYIKNKWRDDKYRGYQIDVNYPIGDVRQSHTPKGIQFGSSTLELSNLFIGSYRGGRNECFRYGTDKSTKWFDYDLASCYASIMSMMGDPSYEFTESERVAALAEGIMPMMGQPDYSKGMWIHPTTNLTKLDFINSYSALKIEFCLPKEILYPPFPVTLDESITIYPSTGLTLVTGTEYLTGVNLLKRILDKESLSPKDYYIKILYGSYIPFKTTWDKESKSEILSYSPFFELINELQANRRFWKKETGKGSAMERIYKDLGNMLYGKIVCGISNKKVYDSRTFEMKTMLGNDLANPILGTWITGFVRSLIAECLFNIQMLGGQVVSCTTDGFVTDVENLEEKIINLNIKGSLLQRYKDIREKLSGDDSALEIKTSVRGIMQWTTRGQLSLESIPDEYKNMIPITAATGYQKSRIHEENVKIVQESLQNNNKVLFLQTQLSGALDLYKTKDHVSMKSSQRVFKTVFDSKRIVIESSKTLLDTRAYLSVSEALLQRSLMSNLKSKYSNEYSVSSINSSKSSIDETVKYFIRMIVDIYTKVPKNVKFNVFSLLNSIDKSIKEDFILNLFSHYEQDKGSVITKLPVFKSNSKFVKTLYDELLALAQVSDLYTNILNKYLVYFDNFIVLPRTIEVLKKNLIAQINNLNDREKILKVEELLNKLT